MKIFKFFFKTIAALILVFLILWVSILGFLQTKFGQDWATRRVIALIEQQTNSQIQLEEIHFEFPLTLQFKNLALLHNQEKWILIDDCRICCLYPSLLEGHLVFSTLHMNGVHLLNFPPSSPSSTNEETKPWEKIILPLYVQINDIDIRKINLSPALLDQLSLPDQIKQQLYHSYLTLQGMFGNYPIQQTVVSHLKLKINDEKTHQLFFKAGVDLEKGQLAFHSMIDPFMIPALPTSQIHASLQAKAPLSAWQTILSKRLQSEHPLMGDFKLIIRTPKEEDSLISDFLGSKTFLKGNYSIHSLDAIQLTHLKLHSPTLQLEGETILTSQQEILEGKFKGQLDHLERFQMKLGEQIRGMISFEGFIHGPLTSPFLNLTVNSPSLSWANHAIDRFQMHLDTTPQKNLLKGLLAASFDYQHLPWQIHSSFEWANQKQLQLTDIQITTPQNKLTGDLNYSTNDSIVEGAIQLSSENFNEFASFFGQDIQGKGSAHLRLFANKEHHQAWTADVTGQDLQWKEGSANQLQVNLQAQPADHSVDPLIHIITHLKGKTLQWKDIHLSDLNIQATGQAQPLQKIIPHLNGEIIAQNIQFSNTSIKQAQGLFDLKEPLDELNGNLKWTLNQIKKDKLEIAELKGDTQIHPSEDHWPFQISGKGIWKDQWDLTMQGTWMKKAEDFIVNLNALTGTIEDHPLKLNQPVEWNQTPQRIVLTPVNISWGNANLSADFKQEQNILTGHIQTNMISTELFQSIIPNLPVKGQVSLQGDLSGTLDQPLAKGLILLNKMQLSEELMSQKTFIEGNIGFNTGLQGTDIKSELYGIGKTPLRLIGRIPLVLSVSPLSFQLNDRIPLDLKVDVDGEIEPYLQLVGNDSTNLMGQIKAAIRIKGSITDPQIEGFANLINGFYETNNTGAIYRNIQARIEGNGSSLVLKNFSAEDNKKGTIQGTGRLALNAKKNFPFKIDIKLNQIFVVDADYATMDVSGDLSILGNIKQPKIEGALRVNNAVIRMEESLPTQVKTVDVTYINTSQDIASLSPAVTQEKTSPIQLNIKLDVPNTLSIKGSKLSSEWKGAVIVTGTPSNILLNGDLRISKGEFNLTGKVFELSQGTIHFAGSPSKKTSLYVVASKDIDRIRAEIILKGPLTKPVVTFRSTPPLPQREVLSYILFNRGLSDITSDQGEQLNQSFIELSTTGQKSSQDDFLTRLRNNVGIDRLDFTRGSGDNNDFSLQVGKNFTESICVSFATGSNNVVLEAKLFKNMKLQAEKGVFELNSPIKMSFKWHKDY